MNGQKYYTFKPQNGVRFFALDSNYVDPEAAQMARQGAGRQADPDWKIAVLPSPALLVGNHARLRRSAARADRTVFLKIRGESSSSRDTSTSTSRIKPQKGVAYFIIGSVVEAAGTAISRSRR
jgi:hypothetical protein